MEAAVRYHKGRLCDFFRSYDAPHLYESLKDPEFREALANIKGKEFERLLFQGLETPDSYAINYVLNGRNRRYKTDFETSFDIKSLKTEGLFKLISLLNEPVTKTRIAYPYRD